MVTKIKDIWLQLELIFKFYYRLSFPGLDAFCWMPFYLNFPFSEHSQWGKPVRKENAKSFCTDKTVYLSFFCVCNTEIYEEV